MDFLPPPPPIEAAPGSGSGTESVSSGSSIFLSDDHDMDALRPPSYAGSSAHSSDSKSITWFEGRIVAAFPATPAANEMVSEIKHVLNRKDELKVEKSTWHGMMEAIDRRLADRFNARLNAQDAAIKDLQEANASQEAKIVSLEAKIVSLEAKIASQEAKIKDLQEANASQEAKINAQDTTIKAKDATIKGLRKDIERIKYELILTNQYTNKQLADLQGRR